MLTRRPRSRRWLAVWTVMAALAATGAVGLATGPEVYAAPPTCDPTPDQTDCSGGGSTTEPGTGGGGGDDGGGDGSSGPCTWRGENYACSDPDLGWFSNGCYYKAYDPQPDGLPEGITRYMKTCLAGAGLSGEADLAGDPVAAPPDPEDIAWDILATITLRDPTISMAPKSTGEDANARALVGLPVWMWTEETDEVWGPQRESDEQGGLFVQIEAKVVSIEWDMGDGTVITCTDPGTPWKADYGAGVSPDCGYPSDKRPGDPGYQRSSGDQPGGVYTVTATTTWQIDWEAGNGEAGTLVPNQIRTSQTTIAVDELQVVNR